jgi:hypothetical protein
MALMIKFSLRKVDAKNILLEKDFIKFLHKFLIYAEEYLHLVTKVPILLDRRPAFPYPYSAFRISTDILF